MNLTPDEIVDIVHDKSDDWKTICKKTIYKYITEKKWYYMCEGVFQHIPSEKYYRLTWKQAAAVKNNEPFNMKNSVPIEVEQKLVMATIWMPVETYFEIINHSREGI